MYSLPNNANHNYLRDTIDEFNVVWKAECGRLNLVDESRFWCSWYGFNDVDAVGLAATNSGDKTSALVFADVV